MFGDIFWYGLIAIFAGLIIFFLFYLILKPLSKEFDNVHIWFIVGGASSILVGLLLGKMFAFPFCFGIEPFIVCDYAVRFVIIIFVFILYWRLIMYKEKDL